MRNLRTSTVTATVSPARQESCASAREREALLGFGQDHTIPSVPSAMLSTNAREAEYVRKALLGNSFSCPVVASLLIHLLFDNRLIARRPSLTELSLGVPLRLATLAPVPSTVPAEAPAALADGIAAVSPEKTLVRGWQASATTEGPT